MSLNAIRVILLSCLTITLSFPCYASRNEIKCPSADFLRAQFTDKINDVSRIEPNKFVVEYWDTVTDDEGQRWSISIFADTAEDYDFNEAYHEALQSLKNDAHHPDKPYTTPQEAYCRYVNRMDNDSKVLAFYKK